MRTLPGIKVHPNESFDEGYRKFKKQTDRNLVVTEARARRFFEPKLRSAKNKKLQLARKCLNVFICLDATSQDSKTKTKRALLSLFNSSFSLIFL